MSFLSARRLFLGFLYFWFVKTPLYLVLISKRTLQLLNQELAVGLMLRMLLVPLFGDPSPIGWVVGFLFRLVRIVIGVICFVATLIASIFILLIWAITPIAIFVLLKLNSVLVFITAAVAYYLITRNEPLKKLKELAPYESPLLAAKQTTAASLSSNHWLEKLLTLKDVNDLICRLGVDNSEFRRTLLTADLRDINKDKVIKFAAKTGLEKKTKYLEAVLIFYSLFKTSTIFDNVLTKYELTSNLVEGTLDFLLYRLDLLNPLNFWNWDYELPPM